MTSKRSKCLFFIVLVFLFFCPAAFATSYYVKPDGNDSLDGRSDATAWKTVSKVNSFSFATGDSVFFKCGGTWSGTQLVIDWSGATNNYATIGSYYVSGGKTIQGVYGKKPVFDGLNRIPTQDYAGIIHVSKRNYITIKNLRVINSKWDAVRFEGPASYNNVSDVEAEHFYKVGVKYNKISYGSVERNSVSNGCTVELEGGDWPAALAITGSDHILVKRNKVFDNYGEGIGIYTRSNNCVVQENVCYGNKKVQIYVTWGWNNEIIRNIAYGTTTSKFFRSSWGPGCGIGISDESWQASAGAQNNKIYGNMVAYCSLGIFVWTGFPDWTLKNTEIYNNTIVDCKTNLELSSSWKRFDNSHIKNNIFWCISGDCKQANVPSSHSGLVFSNNLWSSAPATGAKGSNDPAYSSPRLYKSSGWRSMQGGDLRPQDFSLRSDSPAINKGASLNLYYNEAQECDKSVYPNTIVMDFQNKQGLSWEIGADLFIESGNIGSLISPPTTLRVTGSSIN